jgi:DNA-binding phage protein
MTTLTIQLPEESLQKLKDRAKASGLEPEEFVQNYIENWLAASDEEFEAASRYVIQKNSELYRRLAG